MASASFAVGRGGLLQSLDVSWSPCRRYHPAGVSRRISQVRRAMLPSPLNSEARPPGLKYFGATYAFTCVTARGLTHHPFDGFVGGLQSLGFPPPCHPSYRALALTPAGVTPAEHFSFFCQHYCSPNGTSWAARPGGHAVVGRVCLC